MALNISDLSRARARGKTVLGSTTVDEAGGLKAQKSALCPCHIPRPYPNNDPLRTPAARQLSGAPMRLQLASFTGTMTDLNRLLEHAGGPAQYKYRSPSGSVAPSTAFLGVALGHFLTPGQSSAPTRESVRSRTGLVCTPEECGRPGSNWHHQLTPTGGPARLEYGQRPVPALQLPDWRIRERPGQPGAATVRAPSDRARH